MEHSKKGIIGYQKRRTLALQIIPTQINGLSCLLLEKTNNTIHCHHNCFDTDVQAGDYMVTSDSKRFKGTGKYKINVSMRVTDFKIRVRPSLRTC
jgi:hypothetical protein